MSLFNADALAGPFVGHEAVVNLASALPSTSRFAFRSAWRENARVRIDGDRAVVDAAIAAGVGIVVQESFSMIERDSGTEWTDEYTPTDRSPWPLRTMLPATDWVPQFPNAREGWRSISSSPQKGPRSPTSRKYASASAGSRRL